MPCSLSDQNMNEYQVRMRYAGSGLLEVKATNETEAHARGEQTIREMDVETLLAALELQHLDTEVTRLCRKCRSELPSSQQDLCHTCQCESRTD
jgi:hypothetical protein